MKPNVPLLYLEGLASTVLRNIGNDLPDNTVLHLRRLFIETAMKTSYLNRSYLKVRLYRVHKSSLLVPITGRMNPVYIALYHILDIDSDILPSIRRSSKWSLSFR
jgi:hypothetical protein